MALRPDIIKLDRSLITDVHTDPAKAALVDSFTRFARRVDSVVCAEGIETEAELEVLGDLDVTYGQGYRLARPGTPWPAPGTTSRGACAGAARGRSAARPAWVAPRTPATGGSSTSARGSRGSSPRPS